MATEDCSPAEGENTVTLKLSRNWARQVWWTTMLTSVVIFAGAVLWLTVMAFGAALKAHGAGVGSAGNVSMWAAVISAALSFALLILAIVQLRQSQTNKNADKRRKHDRPRAVTFQQEISATRPGATAQGVMFGNIYNGSDKGTVTGPGATINHTLESEPRRAE